MSLDPFTQLSRRILAALQADLAWSAMVRPNNIVDMTAAAFQRFKAQLQPADVPEVILLQQNFRMQPYGPNSRLAEFEQDYQLILTFDSLHSTDLNALKFRTLIALTAAGPELGLPGLVRRWEIRQGSDDILPPKAWKRTPEGWVDFLTISVQMYFERATLLAFT